MVRRIRLMSVYPCLNGRFACLNDRFVLIMAKQQVIDCLPFSV
jgi:hypothetical protein